MKKLTTIIAALVLLIGVGVIWAQQERMFIHSGNQIHQFATTDVDSIVPVLKATANLDELHLYKDGEVFETFLVNEVDSIIFYEVEPELIAIDLSGITWEESYIYSVKVGDKVIAQLAYEFLHKHLPDADNPIVRRRTVVAYPVLNEAMDLANGLVIDNGNKVSWNLKATLPHELLTYQTGETVGETAPTMIYFIPEESRLTTIDDPSLLRVQATVTPYTFRDQRTGPANVWEQTTEDFTYGMVKIGAQIWMRENLRTTRWTDGRNIPTDFAITGTELEWTDALEPGCLLGIRGHSQNADATPNVTVIHVDANNPAEAAVAMREKYGVLYNWFAMTAVPGATIHVEIPAEQIVDMLSPEGWSVPVRAQFSEMVKYVYNVASIAGNPTAVSPIPGAFGGRLSGYTVDAYPETDSVNTVPARPENASNLSGFTAIGNVSRSNTASGTNGGTMFLMLDGYGFRSTQTTRLAQHSMNFFQVNTHLDAGHTPAFPAVQSAHRAKYVRLVRDICVHDFAFDTLITPTCLTGGYSLYKCENCIATERRNRVNALGHDDTGPDATCTTDKVCAREGCTVILTRVLGHDHSGPAATCISDQVCARTGCDVVLVEKDPDNHDFHHWTGLIASTAPTCDNTGLADDVCALCHIGETDIELSKLTPQNLRSVGATMMWDAVDLATGYVVDIDGVEHTVGTNSLDMFLIILETPNVPTYDIKVKPIGNEDFFKDNTCWSAVYTFTVPSTTFVIEIEDLEFEDSYVYEIVVDEGGVDEKIIGQLAFEFLYKHIPGEEFPVVERRALVAYTASNGRANLSTGLVVNNGNFISWNVNANGRTPAHEILTSYTEGEEDVDAPRQLFLVEGSPRITTIDMTGIDIPGAETITTTLRPLMLRDERTGAAIHGETTEVEYYGVVKIGIQYWTRENLRTRRLADGTPIQTGDGTVTANPTVAGQPWLDAMIPGAFTARPRGITAITGTYVLGGHQIHTANNQANAFWNAQTGDTNEVAKVIRDRYGVVYNFHAVTNTTGTLGTELVVVDRLSPEGWSIPKIDNFAMLVNYVYNVFNADGNLPTGTGVLPAITGTSLSEGRLSGYTREAYPAGTGTWRASNISGFGAVGNNGRSSSLDGWNSNTRLMAIDSYLFREAQASVTGQHAMIFFQLRTANDVVPPDHSPSWRLGNTHWAEGIRLVLDPFCEAHDFGVTETIAPTCLQIGYQIQTCKNCGATRNANEVPALGHDNSGPAPTCTTGRICARFGCDVELTPALGHDDSAPAATCIADQVCARLGCDHVLVEKDPTNPLFHKWDDLMVAEGPTCDVAGEGKLVCVLCQDEGESFEITKLTPQNVRSEGAMLKWDAVDFATGYVLDIEGVEHTTTTNSFDLYPILLESGLEFDIKVRPEGDEDFFDGNTCWSAVYEYIAPTVFVVDIDGFEFEDSYVYEIVNSSDEVIGQLTYEFLHKHIPAATEPVVRERTVVAYAMLENGRANLSTGLVVNNGNFVSWNSNITSTTPAHEMLISYVDGEGVTSVPTEIFFVEGSPRFTVLEIPGSVPIAATLRPLLLRDEREGVAINGETKEVEYYGLVKIGTQYWTRENLRTTRLADGTPIPTNFDGAGAWTNMMIPGCMTARPRGIPGITEYEGQATAYWNANDPNVEAVEFRSRYGVLYNLHAVTNVTGVLGTELTITDRLSPEGWSIPKVAQFVILVNYVYNGSNAVPTITSQTTTNIPNVNLNEGRLSGYTVAAYPIIPDVAANPWRASNISGFSAIGNNGRSVTENGFNGHTRFMSIDGYFFRSGQAAVNNQHSTVFLQINTNEAAGTGHQPAWRSGSTHWAEGVRLIMD
jgi:hypothetical protein